MCYGASVKIRISTVVQKVLDQAWADARTRGHEYVTPEHILLAVLDHPPALRLLSLCGADIAYIHDSVDEYLRKNMPILTGKEPLQTVGFQNVFQRALFHCESAEKPVLEIGDVLVSLIDEHKNYCSYYMRRGGLDRLVLLEVISHGGMGDGERLSEESSGDLFDEGITEDPNLAEEKPFVSGLDALSRQIEKERRSRESARGNPGEMDDESSPDAPSGDGMSADEMSSRQRPARKSMLERYTVELTALAREGKLEPLIGREEELERTVQVLCRRMKNNPVHVGDAGVGKTAITEGLAQRIANKEVPQLLWDYEVYSLDMGALVAGTKFRGDFEDRIKKVMDELLKKDKSILFIDEIHTIIGAGSTGGGTLDASNLMKPVLASGKIRCIGSTTYEEYSKHFEKDHALSRRFQKIDIAEPSEKDTVAILNGLKKRYESFHGVVYTPEAIEQAVHLSAQFINDRRLPDKAIDVIDEAGARVRINAGTPVPESVDEHIERDSLPVVDRAFVETVVAKIARIPERTVSSGETDRLRELEPELMKSIYGQDEAVRQVVTAVKRSRAGFRSPGKPVANFLFVGPTGVGKTELARTLSRVLGIALHRFDMSEYQEKHAVSRLIGSPPGYVGFDEGGLLTDAVRKKPHAVLLLDEIEKAHQDIFNILLQIMDYATLTDNQGRQADFRNVILIMTSNAGARDMTRPAIGFGGGDHAASAVSDAVERTFSPEFRNRLDAVVPFDPLSRGIMEKIVSKELEAVSDRLREKSVSLDVQDEVVIYLAEHGYSAEYGARNAARLVEERITNPLVDMVLFGDLSRGGTARCELDAEVSGGIRITVLPRETEEMAATADEF